MGSTQGSRQLSIALVVPCWVATAPEANSSLYQSLHSADSVSFTFTVAMHSPAMRWSPVGFTASADLVSPCSKTIQTLMDCLYRKT